MKKPLLIAMALALAFPIGAMPVKTVEAASTADPFAYLYSCPRWDDPTVNTGLSRAINEELIAKDVPMCITVRNEYTNGQSKTFTLNSEYRSKSGLNVYGKPSDVPDNDKSSVEYRFWRFGGAWTPKQIL